jgi:hypothetical protein
LDREIYWEEIWDSEAEDKVKYGTAYQTFAGGCADFIASGSEALFPPLQSFGCQEKNCIRRIKRYVCHHDVEKTFRGSGVYSEEFLQKQGRTWHPYRLVGQGETQKLATELFQMIGQLVDGPEKFNN